jgi:hypothetical protein
MQTEIYLSNKHDSLQKFVNIISSKSTYLADINLNSSNR